MSYPYEALSELAKMTSFADLVSNFDDPVDPASWQGVTLQSPHDRIVAALFIAETKGTSKAFARVFDIIQNEAPPEECGVWMLYGTFLAQEKFGVEESKAVCPKGVEFRVDFKAVPIELSRAFEMRFPAWFLAFTDGSSK